MKRIIAAAALILTVSFGAARAELPLYIGEGTVSRVQAQEMADRLKETLGVGVRLMVQEETGESISGLLAAGDMPRIAVLSAEAAAHRAREGLLLPLEGCIPDLSRVSPELVDACVEDEQLMFAPLSAQRRMLAVRPDGFEAVNMGYLMDSRAHPVWYPSELVQALDEMALTDGPGMDVWPPEEENMLWLEALLQGISGQRFEDKTTGAYAMDEEELALALEWMQDMIHAGLIDTASSREEALERFVNGETAVFADWTAEESERFAQAIRDKEIVLRPYPSLTGTKQHAAKLTVVCAFSSTSEQENALSRRAAASLLSADADALWKQGLSDDGAAYLPLVGTKAYGATLRALLCGAMREMIAGEADALNAARRIERTMRTAGF